MEQSTNPSPQLAIGNILATKNPVRPGRSLAELRPEVAVLWAAEANGDLTPEDVYSRSNRSVWWICPAGHPAYLARINTKSATAGCPMCRGYSGVRSLADVRPDLAAAWDTEANGTLTPADVKPSYSRTVFWICPNGHGSYAMRIMTRVKKTSPGCAACSRATKMEHLRGPKPDKRLAEMNPALAAQWDAEANGDLTPGDVSVNSLDKAWWTCSDGHPSFFSRIANRNAGSGCPECGRGKTIAAALRPTPGQSLADLFPDIAAEWDTEANGGLTAAEISSGSGRRMHWTCPKGHGSYVTSPTARTSKGAVCPVCAEAHRADLRALPAPGRSLAELRPEIAAEWDAAGNGPRTPGEVAATSKRVYSWLCPVGHPAYRMRVVDRWHSNSCPVCDPRSAHKVVAG